MNKKETNQLYTRVGRIVKMSQMVEYNLAKMQAYGDSLSSLAGRTTLNQEKKKILKQANVLNEKGLTQTLGWNITRIKKLGILDVTPELENKFDFALKERNYVIHQLFKSDIQTKKIQKHSVQVLDRLKNDLGMLKNLNDFLLKTIQSLIDQLSVKLQQ